MSTEGPEIVVSRLRTSDLFKAAGLITKARLQNPEEFVNFDLWTRRSPA